MRLSTVRKIMVQEAFIKDVPGLQNRQYAYHAQKHLDVGWPCRFGIHQDILGRFPFGTVPQFNSYTLNYEALMCAGYV